MSSSRVQITLIHQRRQRFHRRVRQIRKLELGIDGARRGLDGLGAAVAARRAARLGGERPVLGHLGGRADTGRQGPVDGERIAALLGRPVAIGDHRHTAAAAVGGHRQHGLHALDGARPGIVHLGHAPAEHRRPRDQRHAHIGQAVIDAETGPAVDLVARIEAAGGLADQLEVLAVGLHAHALRHRQPGGGLDKAAVGGAPLAAADLDDHAVARVQALERRLPLRRRCLEQHESCAGADGAELGVARGDRCRAAGHLDTEARVRIHLRGRRMLGAHLVPVAVQFLGDQHRHRCHHALAELQLVDEHGHGVVGRNAYERRRRVNHALLLGLREAVAGRQRDAEQQAAARKAGGTEELAAPELARRGGRQPREHLGRARVLLNQLVHGVLLSPGSWRRP